MEQSTIQGRAYAENPLIPDEEIDAEDAATQARIAEEDAALEEVDREEGVETLPANDPLVRQVFTGVDVQWPEGRTFEEAQAEDRVEFADFEPPFDPEIFERGPLAAGIRMCEALLTEARSGYINAQIEELERVLDLQLDPAERGFLGAIAAQERTASGLPDVAGAYTALVRAKAQVQA